MLIKRRTIRLFKQKKVPRTVLEKALNAARLAPSAANLQFLEYLVVTDPALKEAVFSHLQWAGYVRPRRTPAPHQRPSLYILILANKQKSETLDRRDVGAAVENMLLALWFAGIGSCWIASVNRQALSQLLGLCADYEIDSVVACGYPAEKPKLETDSENIRYWLDASDKLHVPKRPLQDIVHYNHIAHK